MSRRWVQANLSEFARDVMRDYCMACAVLEAQFERFEASGAVSFPVMRDLLGEAVNKGLLWRLKDTAHHLFRSDPHASPVALMLDWAIGYVFHECIKLKEDAYQHQHYAPQYRALQGRLMDEELLAIVEPLASMLAQTRESMDREIRRIRYILASSRRLLCLYFATHGDNRLLARLLHDRAGLVRDVFGDDHPRLVAALYGDRPELLYVQAAEALLEGGRPDEALRAIDEAETLRPDCPEALALRNAVAQMSHPTSSRRATTP